ncbi:MULTISPECIES: COX15/CtaA family protein [Corallincola]|uniref:Heme A synthase n=3 Tax=Corallincola TaxID=1775176 RepID=A0A368NKI3_9GAMM|nr:MULTISPECIES: COX15/CtaA family protein [Corallincola]RCU51117.1 heme A synthase [Corallincola holothuriorum]TAA46049.1 heme A synthase [Corallincola spongiicola]TCI01413.1 heme A synthase [Corallincola luteus]
MKALAIVSTLLALVVISLGAYTRLTDAGLGCPDWPGCYGHLTVPAQEQAEQLQIAFPERPLEPEKAWNEMIHRYVAGGLGLLVLAMAILAWKQRDGPVGLPSLLLLLVIFQAALGMWTVTMNLMPVVVLAHLLGGFATFCLLLLLVVRLLPLRIPGGDAELRRFSGLSLAVLLALVLQIVLGGWTSTNYAALACTELPFCENGWLARLDFSAFQLWQPGHENYEFGVLDYAGRMTIHVVHRLWAIVVLGMLLWFSWRLFNCASSRFFRRTALALVGLLLLQVGLGISNVVLSLPLPVAVAHNVVAACLLGLLVITNYALLRKA